MTQDWKQLHHSAQLAEAAYIDTMAAAVSAFNALGHVVVARYLDGDHQAFLLHSSEGLTLAIAGTRFGRSLGDLLDDADIVATELAAGARVASGPYSGMGDLWRWALGHAAPGSTFAVCGHSLGGERTLMTELFLPAERIRYLHAFEAPKCGNAAFWASIAKSVSKATCVINGSDLWAGWPLVSEWSHPPIPHIHLLGDPGRWEMVGPQSWPDAIDPNDHAIGLVAKRLGDIAGP